jgi:hypothetical protein
MKTKLVAGLIVSAALSISPVVAATQTAAPKSAETGKAASPENVGGTAAAAEEKKICKQLPSSSSRLSNRACLTAREWKQVQEEVER